MKIDKATPFNQNGVIGVDAAATAAFEKTKEIEAKFEGKIESAAGNVKKIARLNKRAMQKMGRKVPRAEKKARKKGYTDSGGKYYPPSETRGGNFLPTNEDDPRYDGVPQQDELNLSRKQIDSMSQEDWDKLPIVTGPKPGRAPTGALKNQPYLADPIKKPSSIRLDLSDKSPISPNLRDDLPKLETEKPQPNRALKITRGILSLLSPHFAAASKVYGAARVIGSKLNKAKIDYRDQKHNR